MTPPSGSSIAARMHSELLSAMSQASSGHPEAALTAIDKLLRTYDRAGVPECEVEIASAMYNKGVLLRDMERRDDALSVWGAMMNRFAAHPSPSVSQHTTRAMFNHASCLRVLGRAEEALRGYERVVMRASGSVDPAVALLFGLAALNQGSLLMELGRHEAAIEACDRVIGRLEKRTEGELLETYITARGNKAEALGKLGRYDDALAVDLETVRMLEARNLPRFVEPEAIARLNAGVALSRLGRHREALASYNALIARFSSRSEPVVKQQVAKALLNRAITLGELGREDDAVSAYADAVRQIGAAGDPVLLECVGKAIHNWKAMLTALGRTAELEHVEAEDMRLRRELEAKQTQGRVMGALHDQALMSEPADRAELFEAMAQEARDDTQGVEPLELAALLNQKAAALAAAERYDEAIEHWKHALQLLDDRRDHGANVATAAALDSIGVALIRLGRFDEAEQVLSDLVQRFTGELHEAIGHHVLRAQDALAKLRRHARQAPPMMSSMRASAPLVPEPTSAGTPAHYVYAELQPRPPLLQIEYSARHASKNAEGITGTAMVLSLLKRIQQEMGRSYQPPELLLCFPATPDSPRLSDPDSEAVDVARLGYGVAPPDGVRLRDANHDLLVEALGTFGLSVEYAMQCMHFFGIAALLDYGCVTTSVRAGGPMICRYVPRKGRR